MTLLLLPALAVAFAAFCIWLTVRIVNRRERWAKWTLAGLVGVPVLYVASFGPACWWLSDMPIPFGPGPRYIPKIYTPIGWVARRSGHGFRSAICWYANIRDQSGVLIVPDGDRGIWLWRDFGPSLN